jgi:hypothetical protein
MRLPRLSLRMSLVLVIVFALNCRLGVLWARCFPLDVDVFVYGRNMLLRADGSFETPYVKSVRISASPTTRSGPTPHGLLVAWSPIILSTAISMGAAVMWMWAVERKRHQSSVRSQIGTK